MKFGQKRYFRPVCILRRIGFYGGPAGYVETDDPDAGPLIIRAIETGDPPLWRVEEILDARENQGR